jgi:mannose-6-phosphate isomerase-like protein (cupin superfamily)
MSHPKEALVVRPEAVERVYLPSGRFDLIADATETGGALGVNRLTLSEGADGARPHHHEQSTELFYVVEGAADFLLDGTIERVGAGSIVIVPPGLVHAFGAASGTPVELFVMLTPAVDRFEYFRALGRIQRGEEPVAALLRMQQRYDVHFADPTEWQTLRAQTLDDAAM